MKIRLKKFLNKYKNRIFSFIAVIACIPLLNFNAFAFTFPLNAVAYEPSQKDSAYIELYNSNNWVQASIPCVYDYGEYSTEFHVTEDVLNCVTFTYGFRDSFTYNFNFDRYDYYVGLNIFFTDADSYIDIDNPLYFYIRMQQDYWHYYDLDGVTSNVHYFPTGSTFKSMYSFLGRMPAYDYSSIRALSLDFESADFCVSNYNELTAFIFEVPKDTTADALYELLDAIYYGDYNTGDIVFGNYSAIDNLDSVVSEYRATEQQFFDDFNSNQQAITNDIVGWSWGGLVDCANWVGETMTDYYNNMGDFRQYIIYPLMLGIVLFFLGRGGSIIGHLFRKPTTTTVNTKSVFRREGNTKYTTTTTSRQGGVFRK